MIYRIRNTQIIIVFFLVLFSSGCASLGPYTVNLADPPEFFVQNKINPLDEAQLSKENIVPIYYVTNREAWGEGQSKYRFYKNKHVRGLNVGQAYVQYGKEGTTWQELKDFILTEKKRPNYRLRVISVDEYGQLNFAKQRWDPDRLNPEKSQVDQRLIKEINEKLSGSKNKNITIFVHGINVPFEDPVLVSAQLAFYGGFDGVAIAFSWPSSQRILGYLADVEQTQYAARYLSFLILFLSKSTDVEKINIIAHSAGSRVLARSLTDLSLLAGFESDRDKNLSDFKVGNVAFAGGDLSRDVMGMYIEYGMIEVSKKVVIYFSQTDKALGMSHWLWKQGRIGDFNFAKAKVDMDQNALDYIKSVTNFELIDATGTPGSTKNYGHIYFLDSQWVSSDIMLFLKTDLSPGKRGLILDDESGFIWKFPKDYKTKTIYQELKRQIHKLTPDLTNI